MQAASDILEEKVVWRLEMVVGRLVMAWDNTGRKRRILACMLRVFIMTGLEGYDLLIYMRAMTSH